MCTNPAISPAATPNGSISAITYAFSKVKNTAVRPDATFFVNPDRGAWQSGILYREFERVQLGGQDFVALRTHTSRDTGVSEPAANQPPDPTFWQLATGPFAQQDHQHSPGYVVDTTRGAPNFEGLLAHRLSTDNITNARQLPHANPMEIANGDFSHVGDLIGFTDRRLPGWTDYASQPLFDPANLQVNVAEQNVTLNAKQPGVTHNWVYIPAEAERLAIDIKVTRFSGNDLFQVLLGDTVLLEEQPASDDVDLTVIGAGFVTHRFLVPSALKEQVLNLSVRLNDGGDNAFNAEVQIDNLRFEGFRFNVLAGDVTLIDLGKVIGRAAQLSDRLRPGVGCDCV